MGKDLKWIVERFNKRLKLYYEHFNTKISNEGKKSARKEYGRNKRKYEEDGVLSIDKIIKQLTKSSKIEEDGVLSIDNIIKESIENSNIEEGSILIIDKITKQLTENSKIKEHAQEVRSENKLTMRESRWKED